MFPLPCPCRRRFRRSTSRTLAHLPGQFVSHSRVFRVTRQSAIGTFLTRQPFTNEHRIGPSLMPDFVPSRPDRCKHQKMGGRILHSCAFSSRLVNSAVPSYNLLEAFARPLPNHAEKTLSQRP